MPKVLKRGVSDGRTKTYETHPKCKNCGGAISSLDDNCPHCGATRPGYYDDVQELAATKGRELTGEDLARVKSGGDKCPACGTFSFNYDSVKREYVCDHCGFNSGKSKTDYELAGGEASPRATYVPTSTYTPSQAAGFGVPLKTKLIYGGVAAFVLVLFIGLIVLLTSTHDVPGKVSSVHWELKAHQEEEVLKNGEGWNLPGAATKTSSESRFYENQPNVVSTEVGTYHVTSTPELDYKEYADIQIETPGAIYTTVPVDCGDPTQEAGGSVSYKQCWDVMQEDSTYGWGKSPATPVYKEPVDVEQTTMPTPIYGTPTPIYREYFFYTFWEWITTGRLDASGDDNSVEPNPGVTDQHHRVIQESETYTIVFTFNNGKTKTITGHDPALLQQYMLNAPVVGKFNKLGGFNGFSEHKVLP